MKHLIRRKLTIRDMVLYIFMPLLMAAVILCGSVSYFLLRRQIQDNTFSNALDIVTQLQMNLDYQMGDVQQRFQALADAPQIQLLQENGSGFSNNYNLNDLMHEIYHARSTILDSIVVVYDDGEEQHRYAVGDSHDLSQISWETDSIGIYPLSDLEPGKLYWVNLSQNDFFNRSEPVNTASLFCVQEDEDSRVLVLFYLREEFFRNLLGQARITEHGYLSLLSEDGEILFKELTPDNTLTEKDLESILSSDTMHLRTESINGNELLVINEPLGVNNWQILAVFPEKETMGAARYIMYVYLGSLALLILLTYAFSNFFANVFSRPIREWIDNVSSAGKGEFDVTFHDNICEEISNLNDGLGELFGKMEEMMEQIKVESATKRELELAILQAQINPHFLYNTLYSIQQLYGMGENEQASQMVANLSSFFRLSLSKGREIITIRDEVEHLKNYIAIQQMRYDQLTYDLCIDDDILDNSIVKLTLQPLVENAIYHGLFGIRRGVIRILGHWENEDIVFKIIDNGSGMPPERVELLNRAVETGDWSELPSVYGTKNVQQRIRLYCGENYGLHFQSEAGKGTRVIVRISASLRSSNIENMENSPMR